jgi:hypothetical protein
MAKLAIITTALFGFIRQSFAQEELVGKNFKEALSYIRTYKTNDGTYRPDYNDTLPASPCNGCAKKLSLSRLEFEKWDNWASLDIYVDSSDLVSGIGIKFGAGYKLFVMDKHDRKKAVKDITKKFGMPVHLKSDTEDIWIWRDKIGQYNFTWFHETGICDFTAMSLNHH